MWLTNKGRASIVRASSDRGSWKVGEWMGNTERVKKLCHQLKPFLGAHAGEIFSAYLLEDKQGKEELEIYLQSLLAEKLGNQDLDNTGDLVPPSAEKTQGEY